MKNVTSIQITNIANLGVSLSALSILLLSTAGCTGSGMQSSSVLASASATGAAPLASSTSGSQTGGAASANSGPITAGNGANIAGAGSLSVPTSDAVVARIQNGLQNNVSPLKGRFKTALAQVKSNLPQVTDPTKAGGYDQVQLLVYAACADLTTGSPSLMQSVYGVNPKTALSASTPALVTAGVAMMNQYTANLASTSPSSTQVNSVLNKLVQTISADPANTTTIAFMTVCIASNTAGTALLGF